MPLSANVHGLGDPFAQFNVYIANRPNFLEYSNLDVVHPLSAGEIHAIGQMCGNGWRKVFNVYAKLVFALNAENIVSLHASESWQNYRDHVLLQRSSNTNLLFSAPQYPNVNNNHANAMHIIMGKTYAKSLCLPNSLIWLDQEFAIDTNNNFLVCPYFDYRQLSNIKIVRLVTLIRELKGE